MGNLSDHGISAYTHASKSEGLILLQFRYKYAQSISVVFPNGYHYYFDYTNGNEESVYIFYVTHCTQERL